MYIDIFYCKFNLFFHQNISQANIIFSVGIKNKTKIFKISYPKIMPKLISLFFK